MKIPYTILGHTFQNLLILRQALTHPSYLNESREGNHGDYQRLEFLGDAVLGLLLADLLMQHFPGVAEGVLSRMRSSLVDQNRLAELAVAMGISPMILMGRGAEQEGGRTNPSILADIFEALIGAIYCDAGFQTVRQVVTGIYAPLLTDLVASQTPGNDPKSHLQERLASQKRSNPVYQIIGEEGPDHDRHFRVAVTVDGVVIGEGEGRSKKTAQQAAARAALLHLLD